MSSFTCQCQPFYAGKNCEFRVKNICAKPSVWESLTKSNRVDTSLKLQEEKPNDKSNSDETTCFKDPPSRPAAASCLFSDTTQNKSKYVLKSGDKAKSTTTVVLSQNIQKFFNILIAKFGCSWWKRYGSNLIRRIAKNIKKRRTRLYLLSDEVRLQQSSNKIHLRSINGNRVSIRQRKNNPIFGKI